MSLRFHIPDFAMLPWESQVIQYPLKGAPGISYFRGETSTDYVDCLLYRGPDGRVWGILNHYPIDSDWEKAHNVNIWIKPDKRRRGIATTLVNEARKRWPINAEQQRLSESGAKFLERYLLKDERRGNG